MALGRWLRHAFTTPFAVRRAFPEAALTRIEQAIDASEQTHSGEIRFAIEAALPWSYLRRDAPARQRAVMVFSKLRVWDTEHNNGVLIYVELADHSIEIVADRGIARHVPQAQWDAICTTMREQFRAGRFEQGSVDAIHKVGELLKRHFPLAGGEQRPDQLPDRPAILR
jgi:uncharacterized membrane protein